MTLNGVGTFSFAVMSFRGNVVFGKEVQFHTAFFHRALEIEAKRFEIFSWYLSTHRKTRKRDDCEGVVLQTVNRSPRFDFNVAKSRGSSRDSSANRASCRSSRMRNPKRQHFGGSQDLRLGGGRWCNVGEKVVAENKFCTWSRNPYAVEKSQRKGLHSW